MNNLLFVCRENRFRSVLAAQYFVKLMNEKGLGGVCVGSAGTWAKNGLEPAPEVRRIAEKHGIDLDHVKSKIVDQELLGQSALIVVMTENQKEALCVEFPQIKSRVTQLSTICEGVDYDISDPFENPGETIENIADEILSLISSGFDSIYDMVRTTPMGKSS
jgi:protein-tyrosine-phosphatase